MTGPVPDLPDIEREGWATPAAVYLNDQLNKKELELDRLRLRDAELEAARVKVFALAREAADCERDEPFRNQIYDAIAAYDALAARGK